MCSSTYVVLERRNGALLPSLLIFKYSEILNCETCISNRIGNMQPGQIKRKGRQPINYTYAHIYGILCSYKLLYILLCLCAILHTVILPRYKAKSIERAAISYLIL